VSQYRNAYRRYCWDVASADVLKLAPFHLLATKGRVHTSMDHAWHKATLARLCTTEDELLLATAHHVIDVTDPASEERAATWWEELTMGGGEGMVVKPLSLIAAGHPAGTRVTRGCRVCNRINAERRRLRPRGAL
jgi:protein phosphatase